TSTPGPWVESSAKWRHRSGRGKDEPIDLLVDPPTCPLARPRLAGAPNSYRRLPDNNAAAEPDGASQTSERAGMTHQFQKRIFTPGLFLNDVGFLLIHGPSIIGAACDHNISRTFIEKIMTVT